LKELSEKQILLLEEIEAPFVYGMTYTVENLGELEDFISDYALTNEQDENGMTEKGEKLIDLASYFANLSYKCVDIVIRDKMEQIDLFIVVKNVIDKWDPCDLLAIHSPDDEYDSEIKDIVKKIDSKSNAKEIAQIISDVFTKSFSDGLFDFSIDNCTEPADKIKYLLDKIKT
jgi:hypothetical protein